MLHPTCALVQAALVDALKAFKAELPTTLRDSVAAHGETALGEETMFLSIQ